jgi:hypothetical protein
MLYNGILLLLLACTPQRKMCPRNINYVCANETTYNNLCVAQTRGFHGDCAKFVTNGPCDTKPSTPDRPTRPTSDLPNPKATMYAERNRYRQEVHEKEQPEEPHENPSYIRRQDGRGGGGPLDKPQGISLYEYFRTKFLAMLNRFY